MCFGSLYHFPMYFRISKHTEDIDIINKAEFDDDFMPGFKVNIKNSRIARYNELAIYKKAQPKRSWKRTNKKHQWLRKKCNAISKQDYLDNLHQDIEDNFDRYLDSFITAFTYGF